MAYFDKQNNLTIGLSDVKKVIVILKNKKAINSEIDPNKMKKTETKTKQINNNNNHTF